MVAGFLRRLVLLVFALGVAAALVFGAIMTLVPSASAKESPILQRDQVGAIERGVAKERDKPSANGSSSAIPVVALVFAGILLLAAQPAQRTYVYYRRPPGSSWQ
jgi:ABC-type phosphate transport system substrate-binding protein